MMRGATIALRCSSLDATFRQHARFPHVTPILLRMPALSTLCCLMVIHAVFAAAHGRFCAADAAPSATYAPAAAAAIPLCHEMPRHAEDMRCWRCQRHATCYAMSPPLYASAPCVCCCRCILPLPLRRLSTGCELRRFATAPVLRVCQYTRGDMRDAR